MMEMNPLDSQSSEEFRQPLLGIWPGQPHRKFAPSANSFNRDRVLAPRKQHKINAI